MTKCIKVPPPTRAEEILFDEEAEERQQSGYDRYTPEPHPAEGLYTDEERARWKI